MNNIFDRTEKLIGADALEKLRKSNVCVFGVGGVGSAVVEGLVRGGIGSITVVDKDTVDVTNINRQIIALNSNVGEKKTEVCRKRILDINPECNVEVIDMFFLPKNSSEICFGKFDYIVDAVDMVSAKLEIIVKAKQAGVPVISSMGTGNKLNASAFEITDISKTSVCPLSRVMRRELKEKGIAGVKVLYSKEEPVKTEAGMVSSISFVPPVAGYLIAGEVIRDLIY